MPRTLEELYEGRSGKVADKWSLYLREYGRIFASYRDAPIRLLEIGVQNGGSLEVWAAYFSNAQKLVGCDINPDCSVLRYDDPRVSVVVGDANSDDTRSMILALTPSFDIIIDDGSHRSSDIVRSFARYFPALAEGGLFVVEDLHCSYWAEYEGGLYHPRSSMTFLKSLADVVNHEHWGVALLRAELVSTVLGAYGSGLREDDLSRVHSVEFCNSMCIIRKEPADHNTLGHRRVTGSDEAVVPGILALQGMLPIEVTPQDSNEWSSGLVDLGERIIALKTSLAARNAQLQAEALDRQRWQSALADKDRQLEAAIAVSRPSAERAPAAQNAPRRESVETSSQAKATAPVAPAPVGDASSSLLSDATHPLRAVGMLISPPGGYYRAVRRARKVLRQKGLGGAVGRLLQLTTGKAQLAPAPTSSKAKTSEDRNDYRKWLRHYDTLRPEGRAALLARVAALRNKPLISILMPTYNSNLGWLTEAIDSVRGQLYPHWELCIVDDASTDPAIRPLLEAYQAQDPRIRIKLRDENGHICAASNDALEMATGDWITLFDHDDILREHALFWLADAINGAPAVRVIYSDEDKLNAAGDRYDPYFKCDWNPDLFLSHNLISHLGAYEAGLLGEVGGFRLGFEGSQDYDLALRCVERIRPQEIHHIPRVLYTWRVHAASTALSGDAKPYALLAGQRALDEHYQRCGIAATTELTEFSQYRVRYRLPEQPPLVSLIIPTRNSLKLTRQCIDSIIKLTTYSSYEILLVDNGSDDSEALAYFAELAKHPKVRVLRDARPFNYSALNNAAARVAHGEYLCLINNDIEVISPDWLSEMLSIAAQEGVGAVGARLWYPNNHLQHGGVIIGLGGVAAHAHKNLPRGQHGYCARASLIQTLSAVTGACLLIRRRAFDVVGGLNESELQVAFNDVDLCLKLREAGYRNVWTPYADLYHHESVSRGLDDTPEKLARFRREIKYMQVRWGRELLADPAYSPNLTIAHEDFSLAWPPRLAGNVVA